MRGFKGEVFLPYVSYKTLGSVATLKIQEIEVKDLSDLRQVVMVVLMGVIMEKMGKKRLYSVSII